MREKPISSLDAATQGTDDMRGKPRRLLFVITSLDFGGAETQVVELAANFRRRGWVVGVVSLLRPRAFEAELSDAGVELFSLNMVRGLPDPMGVLRLARIYRRFSPSIVHSHMVHANLVARTTRLFAPVHSLVSTAHNVTEGGSWMTRAYRLTDPLTELTTNVSHGGVERYIGMGAVPSAKCIYMPNGINLTRFRRDDSARDSIRQALGVSTEFVWLAVGRLTLQKDYPTMLEAFSSVPTNSRLWIVGDGELRAECEDLVGALSLRDRVSFLGRRSDVSDLMSAADGYVLSSAWEGLPMVLLEAAASGLPAVATDVGGVSEIIQPGAGHLLSSNAPSELGRTMHLVEESPDQLRRETGARAREVVLSTFDIESVVSKWEGLYGVLSDCSVNGPVRFARPIDHGAIAAAIRRGGEGTHVHEGSR